MKYMGSKRAMLQNGLGHLLDLHARKCNRFVDLFTGSGAVAAHVATTENVPVVAYDLQHYSAVLAGAVITRNVELNWQRSWNPWLQRATQIVQSTEYPHVKTITKAKVADVRKWCDAQTAFPITRAYGGHYFSPQQAIWIDALRSTLPSKNPSRICALAALIQAASQCAAAPGHTAQPFQPTKTAKPFLAIAWKNDVAFKTGIAYQRIASQFANKVGYSRVDDANSAAKSLRETDLVFIDPPYSGVHYSRFYHVLETIARGRCREVSGVGRYPPPEARPRSRYSVGTESEDALDGLLGEISRRGSTAILTFPDHQCSNGLSGESVCEIASEHFRVRLVQVGSRFSTLGGRGTSLHKQKGRVSRHRAEELILILKPRS